jgi:RNA polymerase sigma factor (sigma-70 family)
MSEEPMNEELNTRFQELSADFAAEFDLERGLDRLQAVGRGNRPETENDHSSTEQKEPSSDISPPAMTHPSAKGQANKGPAEAALPMTQERLEAFYTAEYPKLVKTLVVLGATIEEAEDATQRAMMDLVRRSRTAAVPDHPATYVQRAAVHLFIKERQRERERLPRELRGGHLVIDEQLDDRLSAPENEQYIEYLLECLTPTQRTVIKQVMKGLSTREIAEELGKSGEIIRQHLKNARDRLKQHTEIAPLAPRQGKKENPGQRGTGSAVTRPEPNPLEAVEVRITPEHVARRIRELVGA